MSILIKNGMQKTKTDQTTDPVWFFSVQEAKYMVISD